MCLDWDTSPVNEAGLALTDSTHEQEHQHNKNEHGCSVHAPAKEK